MKIKWYVTASNTLLYVLIWIWFLSYVNSKSYVILLLFLVDRPSIVVTFVILLLVSILMEILIIPSALGRCTVA